MKLKAKYLGHKALNKGHTIINTASEHYIFIAISQNLCKTENIFLDGHYNRVTKKKNHQKW